MKKTVILLAALLMTSTAAHAGALAEATHQLSDNMTEQQVKQSLQHFPFTVSLQTCGSETPRPWKCKVLKFTDAVPPSGGPDPQKTNTGTWRDRYTKEEQLAAAYQHPTLPGNPQTFNLSTKQLIPGAEQDQQNYMEALRTARLKPEQDVAVAKLTVLLSQRDDGSWKVKSWF